MLLVPFRATTLKSTPSIAPTIPSKLLEAVQESPMWCSLFLWLCNFLRPPAQWPRWPTAWGAKLWPSSSGIGRPPSSARCRWAPTCSSRSRGSSSITCCFRCSNICNSQVLFVLLEMSLCKIALLFWKKRKLQSTLIPTTRATTSSRRPSTPWPGWRGTSTTWRGNTSTPSEFRSVCLRRYQNYIWTQMESWRKH